jgi:hypothetical protein
MRLTTVSSLPLSYSLLGGDVKSVAFASDLTALTEPAGNGVKLLRRDANRPRDFTDLRAGLVPDLRQEFRLSLAAARALPTGTTLAGRATGLGAWPARSRRAEAAERVLELPALRLDFREPLLEQFLCLLYGV